MKSLIAALALTLVSLASPAFAQAAVKSATWIQPPEISTPVQTPAQNLAAASAYRYDLRIDGGAFRTLTGTVCALTGTVVNCTSPLTAAETTQVSNQSPHTLTLLVSNSFATAASDPLTGAPPAKPANFKLTIVITIDGQP